MIELFSIIPRYYSDGGQLIIFGDSILCLMNNVCDKDNIIHKKKHDGNFIIKQYSSEEIYDIDIAFI